MGKLILVTGLKENSVEDIHVLARKELENPKVLTLSGPGIRDVVTEKASALFVDEDLVLSIVDPPEALIGELAKSITVLAEKIIVVIYTTSSGLNLPSSLHAVHVDVNQDKEKRLREKVLAEVKSDGKKMTDKAFALLKERIKDEALLDEELAKLLNYVGDKKIIEGKDVTAVVTDVNEDDFIGLADAMARRDKEQLMEILENLLLQGTNILAIHAFMARHTRLLLQAKDGETEFKMTPEFRQFSKTFAALKENLTFAPGDKRHYLAYQKPFYAFNLCKASEKVTKTTLLSSLEMLFEFDLAVKKGTRHGQTRFEAGLIEV